MAIDHSSRSFHLLFEWAGRGDRTLCSNKRPRADPVARVIPDIEKLWECAGYEAERLLRQGDPAGARESLRAWMGEVRMTPRAEGGPSCPAIYSREAGKQQIIPVRQAPLACGLSRSISLQRGYQVQPDFVSNGQTNL